VGCTFNLKSGLLVMIKFTVAEPQTKSLGSDVVTGEISQYKTGREESIRIDFGIE
jgi:hypothetical protein